jgi:tetratricopeptide (TPR) repeat protein
VALDQHARAIADYEHMLALDPARGVTHYARARCRARLGDVDGAIEELSALAAKDADVFHVHFLLGKLLMEKGQLALAVDAFSRVIELAPDHVEALANRALLLARLGDRAGGIADAERAKALEPQHPEYVYAAIALRYMETDRSSMIAALGDPIARFPEVSIFLRERAELYEHEGDSVRALADWSRVLEKWPGDAEARMGRAKALGASGRYAEAVEELGRLVAAAPDNAWAYGLRATYVAELHGDDAGIAADWARAGALDPDHLAIRYYRGQYLMRKERYGAAAADFDRVIAIAPTHGEAHYLRAYCLSRIGDAGTLDEEDSACSARYRACVADLERALELGYRTDEVFLELHLNHWYLDEWDAALHALNRGIEALPACSALWHVRSEFRLELKDEEGAAADRARAEALDAAHDTG